jgi:Kyanoviridae exonuclease
MRPQESTGLLRPRFKHVTLPRVDITSRDDESGRWYTTPSGEKYPSVTTVLGWNSDKKWLDAWHDRMGKEEAGKILTQAGARGTDVHALAEAYLNNDPD